MRSRVNACVRGIDNTRAYAYELTMKFKKLRQNSLEATDLVALSARAKLFWLVVYLRSDENGLAEGCDASFYCSGAAGDEPAVMERAVIELTSETTLLPGYRIGPFLERVPPSEATPNGGFRVLNYEQFAGSPRKQSRRAQ